LRRAGALDGRLIERVLQIHGRVLPSSSGDAARDAQLSNTSGAGGAASTIPFGDSDCRADSRTRYRSSEVPKFRTFRRGTLPSTNRKSWPALADIAAPTFIVGGGATSHVPQELLAEASERIPNATLVTIPVGHNVHAAASDAFIEVVERWLRDAS